MGDKQQKPQNGPEDSKKGPKSTGVFINGEEVPWIPLKVSPEEHIRKLLALEIRDDDVLLAAFPKCGTHWLWEVITMLKKQTTEHATQAKEFGMIEFVDVSTINALQSPRVLNTHLTMAHVPEQIFAKKTKIVHVVRNPKDVLISMYFFFKEMRPEPFEQFFQHIVSGAPRNSSNSRSPFAYWRKMAEFHEKNPDHPFFLVYYEDMKKTPTKVIIELAKFLEVSVSDQFCQEVADACHFQKLKTADKKKAMPDSVKELVPRENLVFYRKGVIGDWKNHLTVAQNEIFEEHIRENSQGLPYTFIYE